jgi:hypothetical protein
MFLDAGRGVAVDVHWRLLPEYFPVAFEARHIWSEPRTMPFAGGQVAALGPEQLLLFLCAHAAKHHWERLGWICDIACLIRVETDLDWKRVFEEAGELGCTRMLSVSLLLARELLGAQLPEEVERRVAQDRGAEALAAELRKRMAYHTPGSTKTLEAARLAWRVFDSRRRAVRLIAAFLFVPTEVDYSAMRLPSVLYWLYYPFRALRLLAKYAGKVFTS